ncbi:TIGR04219 family outer membrane beta-barrel protein [Microbulbifer sp. CAU 1566]|uniref:TIGR04219 family outer membrane beta-barrel protein n=1 Tax=Microbulbifer sp. CAU 1566 TaxID=2933269 RepID=UPI002003F5C9|nr:TIGR04219 family outer membrane beta-barrel protein [Microbulbifer sp. CAU 1566]MCK7595789.1 TIGR04219 family outer membrane beta-barrel protein [Microbulbifer sp. CAU 1566]
MKKYTLALCAALASAGASADTILGFDATAGVWKPSYSGDLNNVLNGDYLKEDNNTFLQAALEHPIPLVPNILVAHTQIESGFGGVSSNLDLSHTDATLYYEILDNWVNLDLGLTARHFDGSLDLDIADETAKLDFAGTLPMIYGMARFDLPFTGWSIIAQGNGIEYDGDKITDLTAKVRWDFVPALDFAVEAGYRAMSIDAPELDELEPNLEIKGPYLGLSLHL